MCFCIVVTVWERPFPVETSVLFFTKPQMSSSFRKIESVVVREQDNFVLMTMVLELDVKQAGFQNLVLITYLAKILKLRFESCHWFLHWTSKILRVILPYSVAQWNRTHHYPGQGKG